MSAAIFGGALSACIVAGVWLAAAREIDARRRLAIARAERDEWRGMFEEVSKQRDEALSIAKAYRDSMWAGRGPKSGPPDIAPELRIQIDEILRGSEDD